MRRGTYCAHGTIWRNSLRAVVLPQEVPLDNRRAHLQKLSAWDEFLFTFFFRLLYLGHPRRTPRTRRCEWRICRCFKATAKLRFDPGLVHARTARMPSIQTPQDLIEG